MHVQTPDRGSEVGSTSAGKKLLGTPEPRHFWTGAGGIRLAGDSWGDPKAPLVILQHGGGQTRHAWKGAGERLASAGYYAVAFDARGHGDSDWDPDGHYDQDIMVEDLKGVLSAFPNRRPALVGASMGGGTSLVAVGDDHVDATALVLVDVAPRLEQEGVTKINTFMTDHPDGFGSLSEVAEAIARYQPQRPRPRNLEGLGKNVRLGADGDIAGIGIEVQAVPQYDLAKRASFASSHGRNLKLPTLLVRGGMSGVLTEGRARVSSPVRIAVRERPRRRPYGGRVGTAFSATPRHFLKRVVRSAAHRFIHRTSFIPAGWLVGESAGRSVAFGTGRPTLAAEPCSKRSTRVLTTATLSVTLSVLD
jgi:non-heme chloroperoxidase